MKIYLTKKGSLGVLIFFVILSFFCGQTVLAESVLISSSKVDCVEVIGRTCLETELDYYTLGGLPPETIVSNLLNFNLSLLLIVGVSFTTFFVVALIHHKGTKKSREKLKFYLVLFAIYDMLLLILWTLSIVFRYEITHFLI